MITPYAGITSNAPNIHRSMEYLRHIVDVRLQLFFNEEDEVEQVLESLVPAPQFYSDNSPLYRFVKEYELSFDEYILLLLALAPHVRPNFFNSIIHQYLPQGGDFPEFGGAKGANYRGILPTGETAQFILGGSDYEKRFEIKNLFSEKHHYYKMNVLYLETVELGEPPMSGRMVMSKEYVEWLTTGDVFKPKFGTEFPAKQIITRMDWDDLVLNRETLEQIQDIKDWMVYNKVLMDEWGMRRKLKMGYKALFYGPPGTGKSLTAGLIGKQTGREVYKVDLSMVVSKYIGETEKNLSKVFHHAEHKNWILFFDEADSLFGKRTSVSSSNDKYANQEVSFLLQRVEDYDGLVILASNIKSNIDKAFIRRFQSIIYFDTPNREERLKLWRKAFPKAAKLGNDVDLKKLALEYKFTGALIMNVVRYACLKAVAREDRTIRMHDIKEGIQKEYYKQGKTV